MTKIHDMYFHLFIGDFKPLKLLFNLIIDFNHVEKRAYNIITVHTWEVE